MHKGEGGNLALHSLRASEVDAHRRKHSGKCHGTGLPLICSDTGQILSSLQCWVVKGSKHDLANYTKDH